MTEQIFKIPECPCCGHCVVVPVQRDVTEMFKYENRPKVIRVDYTCWICGWEFTVRYDRSDE